MQDTPITLKHLQTLKEKKHPISMITCYDYVFARLTEIAAIDCLLVGDSVGTNHLGYDSEKDVTLPDMIHHTKAVARGNHHALIVSDLPFNTYTSPNQALESSNQLIQAGAHAVKLEGYKPDIITHLVSNSISTVCHLGLLPQTAPKKALQASNKESAAQLLKQASACESLGAEILILELVPEEVAHIISQTLTIPVIGIGAGNHCDGQVQIIYDILGFSEKIYKHVRPLESGSPSMIHALKKYHSSVKDRNFLSYQHSFHFDDHGL